MCVGSTSTARQTPSFMVMASGCAPPMPPRPAVSVSVPCERAVVVLAGGLGEGLIRALDDALRADVDPRACGHLAVHGEAERFQAAELVPVGPVGHEIRVGDQHTRRAGMRAEDADGLAGLHEQRLVAFEDA